MKTLKKHKFLIIKLLIILIVIVIWIVVFLKMPNRVPIVRDITTWWIKTYGTKLHALVRIIWTLFIAWFILYLADKFEFKKPQYKKIKGFQERIHVVFLLFLAYLFFVMMYITISWSINITIPLLWWIWLLLLISWIIIRNLEKNELIGITTPWAIKDDNNRKQTHKFWSIIFIILWIIFILSAISHIYQIYVMEALLLATILLPIWYSYILSRK
jgi:uncharacterized membrane protein